MPHYRSLDLSSANYRDTLSVRTVAPSDDEEPGASEFLIFHTNRGAHVWLGKEDVVALVDFGRAEVIAWEAQNNRPDEITDAQIMCGARYSDGVDCALPAGHDPIGRLGDPASGEATHVTAGGLVFDEL